MGLTEVQSALARLYTDRPLRERFFADPGAVGRELGLSDAEAAQVAQVSSAQVGFFARSLVSKRRGEVESLLPLTTQILGRQFAELFTRYAAAPIPDGLQKHRKDAVAFAAFLIDECRAAMGDPAWLLDLLRYEAAWLEARSSDCRWLKRHFHYPVGAIVQSLGEHKDRPLLSARPTLGVWFRGRRHGPLRHFLLPLTLQGKVKTT